MSAQTVGEDRYDVYNADLKKPKKLIVCCDGTWQDSDNLAADPTNVTRISRAVRTYDDEQHQQIVYYQAGVGTGFGIYNHIVGGATGAGLAEHIREAYAFLVSNYAEKKNAHPAQEADSIFLIGFSRGAFTARSIGGLIGAMGLLSKKAMPYFYDIFDDWENAGNKPPQFFSKYIEMNKDLDEDRKPDLTFPAAVMAGARSRSNDDIDQYLKLYFAELERLGLSQPVKIAAIGVWDTVGSLGIPLPPWLVRISRLIPAYIRDYSWFDTRIGDHVKNGFQALALDENRAPYAPALWENPTGSTAKIKQVWFPGAHSNVGGSYADYGIADLTIAWMMDHLSGHHETGPLNAMDWIKFEDGCIQSYFQERKEWHTRIVNKLLRDKLVIDDQPKSRKLPGWSLATVYDSSAFLQGITGRRVRTPGRYLVTNNVTGRSIRGKPLQNTNEYIHASVRARVQLHGSAPVIDWGKSFKFLRTIAQSLHRAWFLLPHRSVFSYHPNGSGQPLAGFAAQPGPGDTTAKLIDVSDTPTHTPKHHWAFHGRGKAIALPEDRLGASDSFERQLLSMSNNHELIPCDEAGHVLQIKQKDVEHV